MPQSEPLKPDENSKSQRKRDMLALQKLGEVLIKLTEAQLAQCALPEELLDAIHEIKNMAANEAKRRQLQYIGKLMRHIDVEPIQATLKRMQYTHEKTTAAFHQTEQWREDLIVEGDDKLNAFLMENPDIDRQQLRKLIRNAQQDRKNNKNTGAEKKLFQFIKDVIKE
jgi:ribosome-associated protein